MQYKVEFFWKRIKYPLEINATTFKKWNVWSVKFADGHQAILFKYGGVWMQRNEDTLDRALLNAIGETIDQLC